MATWWMTSDEDLLFHILGFLPSEVGHLRSALRTCRTWRRAALRPDLPAWYHCDLRAFDALSGDGPALSGVRSAVGRLFNHLYIYGAPRLHKWRHMQPLHLAGTVTPSLGCSQPRRNFARSTCPAVSCPAQSPLARWLRACLRPCVSSRSAMALTPWGRMLCSLSCYRNWGGCHSSLASTCVDS